MSKYERLGAYLRGQRTEQVPMTFAEIERVVGTKLPKSQKHQAWWSNSTSNNVMTRVWLDAGYRTEQVDVERKRLVFRRVRAPQPSPSKGMEDEGRMFSHEEKTSPAVSLKPKRHPAWGALKGTFTIAPDWDITKPALDPEELAEWEANLDRMADDLEKHRDSGKK